MVFLILIFVPLQIFLRVGKVVLVLVRTDFGSTQKHILHIPFFIRVFCIDLMSVLTNTNTTFPTL
jgi:hypothetical protein